MSIADFLRGLDYDQLKVAKEQIDRLIKQKESEQKVALFVIHNEDMNYAAFRVDQYAEGVDDLCKEIRKFVARHPGADVNFTMQKHWFRPHEVDDMLALSP